MNRTDSLYCPNGHKVSAMQWWTYSSFVCWQQGCAGRRYAMSDMELRSE